MTLVNREICRQLLHKGRWNKELCILCAVRRKSECENLQRKETK